MSSQVSERAEQRSEDGVERYGALALGGRLRRLSDRIDRDTKSIYVKMGVEFEQRWFPVFNCLRSGKAMSVTEIADYLRFSHVSVSVTRKSLEAAQLVTSIADEKDGRRSNLVLTEKGKALSEELGSLFEALDLAAADLNAEAGNAITALARLEDALDRKSVAERTDHFLKMGRAG